MKKKIILFQVCFVADISANKWESHQTEWLAGSSCPGSIWAIVLSWMPVSPHLQNLCRRKFPHRFSLWLRRDGCILICWHKGTYTWQALRLRIKQRFQHCAVAFPHPKKVKVYIVWNQLLENMAAAEGVCWKLCYPLIHPHCAAALCAAPGSFEGAWDGFRLLAFLCKQIFMLWYLLWHNFLIQWRWCWLFFFFHSEYFVYSAAGILQLPELFWRKSFTKVQPNKYDEKWELW